MARANKELRELQGMLKPEQRKAVELLVENDFKHPREQLTLEDIATEVGVARMTLYRWTRDNDAFKRYRELIADDLLANELGMVYGTLLRMIKGSNPSMKAIDTFLKTQNKLAEKVVQETIVGEIGKDSESLQQQLEDMKKFLQGSQE